MLDDTNFDTLDIASIEHCSDPIILRKSLAVIKSRLCRLIYEEGFHPAITKEMKRMIQAIGLLGIAAADEAIGTEDPTFMPDKRFDEAPPGARTVEEIDAIFNALGTVDWPSIPASDEK